MSDPKRQRTDDNMSDEKELEQVQKVISSVTKVEERLEKVDVDQAKEILGIKTKYNFIKRPTYEERNKLLTEIPHFWKQVFVNHPLVGSYVTKDDEILMEFIQTFDVKFVGDDGTFKMEMTFKDNPYFSSRMLWKQVKFSEDEKDVEVTTSKLTWKDDDANKQFKKIIFFERFVSTDDDQTLAMIIKEEVWKNPLLFFSKVHSDVLKNVKNIYSFIT
ncbi:hypothetical protein PHMEG_00033937 [Phytophthora megakarya]|uniref:Uncharacterized protein n=1 Tax=Phytophthora megakarya TaxID=4795 RepID=A0A225US61_9STRA|nr:hypothetical protein PHMEG_00033937 [Phytophthora megakarya]